MSDPRFDDSELPAAPDGSNRDHSRGLVVAYSVAAFAGVVLLAILYTLTSERLKPTPKPSSAESNQTSQAPAPVGKQK